MIWPLKRNPPKKLIDCSPEELRQQARLFEEMATWGVETVYMSQDEVWDGLLSRADYCRELAQRKEAHNPERSMTADEARARVAHICKIARDDSEAHRAEANLRDDVLRAIASGDLTNAVELAQVALSTKHIKFERWFE